LAHERGSLVRLSEKHLKSEMQPRSECSVTNRPARSAIPRQRPITLPVARRPAQVSQFRFQLADDNSIAVQLDALKGFHALLQATMQAFQHFYWCQLATGRHDGRIGEYQALHTNVGNLSPDSAD
jgi:hypothetical protein